MASRIAKECSAVQRGSGENLGKLIYSMSGFFFAFIFAFYWGYIFTFILLACVPIVICVFGFFAMNMQSGIGGMLKAYAQSAGYAEQALHSIRIVHTYGNEMLEYGNYVKYLIRSEKSQLTFYGKTGLGIGILHFTFFNLYGAAFWFGGYLRFEGISEGDTVYTSGRVIAIMFAVVFGALNLGGGAPPMKAINEGKIAGKMAYDVIDGVPKVNVNKPGKLVKREEMRGNIEFKNVSFTYPSRPEEPVLKNFSCVFE